MNIKQKSYFYMSQIIYSPKKIVQMCFCHHDYDHPHSVSDTCLNLHNSADTRAHIHIKVVNLFST